LAKSEVERVTAETKLALAYLGSAAKQAERQVAARLVEGEAMATTVGSISRSMNLVRRSASRSGSE
jgi:hypothetical protein